MTRAGRTAVSAAPSWFSGDRARTPSDVQVFCFPHAGGGGATYWPWRRALAPAFEVCPVVLPGRESRSREPAFRRLEQFLEPLCEALADRIDRPFALFGHSLGTLLAYEAARRLTARTMPPLALVVSGRRGPWIDTTRRRFSGLSGSDFLAAVTELGGMPPEILGSSELMAAILPTLRADFEISENYHPQPGPALSCPIIAYTGADDPEVNRIELLGWEEETSGEFSVRVFSGNHFYLKGGRPDVLSALRADLCRLLAG
jgi:surfactin synthase thioesterase subunit